MLDGEEYGGDLMDLYEMFPFFRSFPFDDYDIELDTNSASNESSLLDPIIIKAGGGYVEPYIIHFTYSEKLSDIILSLYTYDIKYIVESSDRIKKMDDISKALRRALDSRSLADKLEAIKQGEKSLLKKIGSGILYREAFNKILDQLNEINGNLISKSELKRVKSLSPKISDTYFSEDQMELICGYYDMHLHHINIVLGIIIAVKIHL